MSVNKKYLFSCIILSLLLCYAQITANALIRIGCLGAYLLMLGWACSHNCTLLILLFFMPWSPLMRPGPDSYSFYTFGLVLCCIISVIRNNLKLKKYSIISGLFFAITTLTSKLLDGSGLSFDYIAFLMMIVLFPVIQEEGDTLKNNFYQLVVFLSLGVIIASLCALNLAGYANIQQYIIIDEYQTIIRRSGFYGDANFYVAQILAALGGALSLILQEKKYSKVIFLMVIISFLLYCGSLSGSKSFALTSIAIFLIWIVAVLKKRGQVGRKLIVLLCFAGLAVYISMSELFGGLLDVIDTRFSRSSDFNSFTTGRADLWIMYIDELFNSFKVSLLGKGFTNIKLNERGSHSTIIQLFYQFGLVGVPIMIYWIVSFYRSNLKKMQKKECFGLNQLMVFVGTFIPWLALDLLFFDEFFLFQWYMVASLEQYADQSHGDNSEQIGIAHLKDHRTNIKLH